MTRWRQRRWVSEPVEGLEIDKPNPLTLIPFFGGLLVLVVALWVLQARTEGLVHGVLVTFAVLSTIYTTVMYAWLLIGVAVEKVLIRVLRD